MNIYLNITNYRFEWKDVTFKVSSGIISPGGDMYSPLHYRECTNEDTGEVIKLNREQFWKVTPIIYDVKLLLSPGKTKV